MAASSIQTFEALVRDRRHEAALQKLSEITHDLEHGKALDTYTSLAASIAQLFADPKLKLSGDGFHTFLARNRVFSAVFEAGGFETPAHVVEHMRGRSSWLLQPLETIDAAALARLRKMKPSEALPIVCALLCRRVVVNEAADKTRDALLELGDHLATAKLRPRDVDLAVSAWMLCSYASTDHRHDFKGHLAEVFACYVGDVTLPERPSRDRPVAAVLSEHFQGGHAMFRCYARSIAALRRDFRVVLFSAADRVDEAASAYVDEVVEVDFDPEKPRATVDKVLEHAPDVVYYPSLGMADWTVVLSNVRLAPIQVMSLGHPATSRSPVIDYLVTEEDHTGATEDYSETVVLMRQGGHEFLPATQTPVEPNIRADATPFRIAVPSNALKISTSFIDACRRIQDGADREIEFHFFPNLRGVTLAQVEAAVRAELDKVVVHAPVPYDEYLALLGRCDLHLSTFPFGGTNSNIDTMRLGIPMVALDGPSSAAAGDMKMLRRIGLADRLVAPDAAAYVITALELINDDAERVRLSEAVVGADALAVFHEGADAENEDEFADTVRFIHDHHDALRLDGRAVWRPADREEYP